MNELSDYCIGKQISDEGGFGVIHVAKHYETGEYFVIKIMDKEELNDGDMSIQIQRELDIHSQLKHPNIVEIVDHFEDDMYIYIILEYMVKGDLFDLLYSNGGGERMVDEEEAKRYIYCIARGLEYIHSKQIIHRDIKLENLLVDEFDNVKLGDFGWSIKKKDLDPLEMKDNKGGEIKSVCGTKEYMSPELFKGDSYDEKIDIWSLGIVMYELLTGDVPYKKKLMKHDHIFKKHIVNFKVKYPDFISGEAVNLMKQLLNKDPKLRPNAKDILKHPWLQDFSISDDSFDEDDMYSNEETHYSRRYSV